MSGSSRAGKRKDSAMRVCIFEDSQVADLEPLTLTRPVFDLLCGQCTLAAKQFRFFSAGPRAALVRPSLACLVAQERNDLAVNHLAGLRSGLVVLVNGRWLPPTYSAGELEGLDQPCVGVVQGELAYAVVDGTTLDGILERLDERLHDWRAALPVRPAGGRLIQHLWELVEHNAEQIVADWRAAGSRTRLADGLAVVGPREQVLIDPSARIDPFVVSDTTNGPVVIEREAVITAFTRLEGPCHVGPRSQVHGAKVRAGTTLGPECRIGGEIEASIVQGFSNKYHDGFLGHAYVGSWVNLGAGTQNSDLRNDYGPVRVQVNGRLVDTGRTKVGCFLGDHTKTGLCTLLNTGTSAGAFCNLLPSGGLLPRAIPSFARVCDGIVEDNKDLQGFLRTAGEVMRRRGRVLTEAHRGVYQALYQESAASRRQALREPERRRLRRSG
jgi:UDP-N-acetylglucosamine diphosphorylase/glucosamine-1-phosphate N-acetyltransferase